MRSRLLAFISIVQAILFVAHWFVYGTLSYFRGGWASAPAVKLAFALLSVSFVLASLRGWYSFHPLVRVIYSASAIWLGFASFFLLASVTCWIVYGISAVAGLGFERAAIADYAFAAAVVAGLCGMLNAALPRVVRLKVSLANLPSQWSGRTAALVSDLHLGHVRNGRFVTRVVSRIAELRPDIVLVAGDLYDGVAANFKVLAQPWKRLTSAPGQQDAAAPHRPPFGVYYIAGNHEEFYRDAEYLPPLLDSGVRVLNNEKVDVDGLQLAGVHYRDAAHPERYRAVLQSMNLDRGRACVLLLHAPVQLPISEAEGISLQLSGHTHGGQLFPWTLIAQRVWGKFIHGLQLFGKMWVYTTYGTGTWGPPLRLGTTPEIVLITFV